MTDSNLLRAAREADLEAEVTDAITETERRDSSSNANKRFLLAILGVLPWVGVLISASIARWAERDQDKANSMFRGWLQEHEERFAELERVADSICTQAQASGPDAQAKLNSEAFLPLVRQGFRVWDRTETRDKRELIRRVLTNAACDPVSQDDFVRRFIEWIDSYNELHFQVVRELYRSPRSTRADIWDALHAGQVREDSAEADLFKLLVRDLSTGQVIRQARATDAAGNFLKKQPGAHGNSRTMKSAFDDKEAYVLTELGRNFVHYALNEVVPKLPAGESNGSPAQQAVAADGRASVLPATSFRSPVVKYHGLGLRHRSPARLLVRPLPNGGTLAGLQPTRLAMPDVLAFSSGDYAVEIALREPPLAYPSLAEPGLREDFGLSESGTLLVVTAGRADADHRSVDFQFDSAHVISGAA
jgi:hypothetical protein